MKFIAYHHASAAAAASRRPHPSVASRGWSPSSSLRFALPALAAALALAGCSSGGGTLARVGDRTITVAEFEQVAQRAGTMYGPVPDSAKKRLLDDLIQRALMLEAAKREPWASESELAKIRERTENEILGGAIVERLVPREIPVSEGEARMLYERRAQEARLQVIYTFDKTLANAAMSELKHGRDFTEVATRFNLPGLLPGGGDLGFVTPGTLPAPLDDWLTDAPLDRVQGPVHAADEAWYVARVLARRPRTREPFEAEQMMLTETIRQRKRRALSIKVFQKLREEYGLRVEPGAPQLLFARYNHAPEDTADTQDPTIVLARYRGLDGHEATYKLRDAIDDLESGTGDRPNPTMLPSFEQWIEARTMQRIVLIEARRRRLHQEPAIAKRVQERVDNYVLNTLYESVVAEHAQTTPQDLEAAFVRQAPMLTRLVSIHVQHLTLPDSMSAMRVLEHVRGAPTLRDAILLSSPGLQVVDETIPFPTQNPVWSSLEQGLQRMPPGSYGGPVQLPQGWRVIQLISSQHTQPTLETMDPQAQRMVMAEADNLARERRLMQYSDSLRHVLPVVVDTERLKRLPWPGPTPETTG
jgi:peptidyl-prolyl cis-trans isomerase C